MCLKIQLPYLIQLEFHACIFYFFLNAVSVCCMPSTMLSPVSTKKTTAGPCVWPASSAPHPPDNPDKV